MKKIALSVLAVALLVSCATQSAGPDLLVNVLSGSETKAAFVPPSHNRFPEGHHPATLVWLSPESAGKTETGQMVSGFKFTSWRLEEGARVQVYALTGPAFSTNVKALKAVRIADFTVQPGSEVQIEQMSTLGVSPMSLRISEYGART